MSTSLDFFGGAGSLAPQVKENEQSSKDNKAFIDNYNNSVGKGFQVALQDDGSNHIILPNQLWNRSFGAAGLASISQTFPTQYKSGRVYQKSTYGDLFYQSSWVDSSGGHITGLVVCKDTNCQANGNNLPQVHVVAAPINNGSWTYTGTLMQVKNQAALGIIDYNAMTETGIFLQDSDFNQSQSQNRPTDYSGMLEVVKFMDAWIFQRYTSYVDSTIYVRRYYGSGWSAWVSQRA